MIVRSDEGGDVADEGSEFFDQYMTGATAPAPRGDADVTLQELMMPTLRPDAAASGGSGGGGRFTVMPDQIPAAIALFEQARNDMQLLAARIRNEAVVRPPGADLVSREVAAAMTTAGVEGPESALGAAQAAVAEFQRIIDALKATGRTYGVAEQGATGVFNG